MTLRLDFCSHEAAKHAVLRWHYSRQMPAAKLVRISVWKNGRFVGVILYGSGANRHLARPFGLQPTEACELVRVALAPNRCYPTSRCLGHSSEILKLSWEEVDFERQCLNLSDSKTGKRTVMLNSAALEILEGLERAEGNPFVIPGSKHGKPLGMLPSLWDRVRVEADIADVRVHDLRHHFASAAINNGHNLSVISKLLGHSKMSKSGFS